MTLEESVYYIKYTLTKNFAVRAWGTLHLSKRQITCVMAYLGNIYRGSFSTKFV